METIRLVDVEVGDRLQIIGHRWTGKVIRLDRITDKVSIMSDDGRFGTFDAKDVIGHLREYRTNCYRIVWSRNKGLIKQS